MGNEQMYEIETFSNIDLNKLSIIQEKFIDKKVDFIYFRKGEAENNVRIAAIVVAIIIAIYKFTKDYPQLKEGVKVLLEDLAKAGKAILSFMKKERQVKIPDLREIACPDNVVITKTLELLRELGGDVRYLPKEQRGKFRYFVNNNEYCLFIRREDGTFSGIKGNNPSIIESLKEAFESEWNDLGPIQKDLRKSIPGIGEAEEWVKRISE